MTLQPGTNSPLKLEIAARARKLVQYFISPIVLSSLDGFHTMAAVTTIIIC